jgi:penicillin-binding protein 1A
MFPSLSDKTKSFLAACAVLAVAVSNVVFGMDWVGERPPVRPVAAVTGVSEAPVPASPPVQAVSPAPPAASSGPPLISNPAPPPQAAPRPSATVQTNEPAEPAAEAAPPKCDIAACAAAYRTFTASDCTYAPSFGVRRLCTKGTPPQ